MSGFQNVGGGDDSGTSADGPDMTPHMSSFSVDSQGALHLDHGIKKWIKVDGDPRHRPVSSFVQVTFHARINAQIYDPRGNNNINNGNTNNMRSQPLLDTFGAAAAASPANSKDGKAAASGPVAEPLEVILGVTKIFRGLEIALRSMSVGEQSDFYVPPEMAHYFGAGDLPMRCVLDVDIKLLSAENFHPIPRLPTVDYEPFKIVRTAGAEPRKRIYLGSTVEFFVQRPHERTGQMTTPKKMTVIAGAAQMEPALDMMLMSMSEREISTFVVRVPMDPSVPPMQYIFTVVKVTPPTIGINVSSAHVVRAYSGSETAEFNEHEYGGPLDLRDDKAAAAALAQLQETAKNVFQEQAVVAAWHFAAASAVARQRGGSMDAVNETLARLTANMGRCAFRLKRFSESLSLARESYTFDQNSAKGGFLLAQSLREMDSLNEALTILKQVEGMKDAHGPSIAEEKATIEALIARRDAMNTSGSASSSAQGTPQKR